MKNSKSVQMRNSTRKRREGA